MSDVTNNEEIVETEEAETVAQGVSEAVAEVVAEEVVAEVVAEAVAEENAEAVVEEVVAEAPVAAVNEAAPAPTPAPAAPKVKTPATFVIKNVARTEDVAVVESEDDGSRVNPRKVREGIVLSNKMDKTLVVAVYERVTHAKYGKTVQRTKKLYVHDDENTAKPGDRVRVQETRPLSKLKRWRLTEVVERAR
jgi:small subunit ribosomal protein S17